MGIGDINIELGNCILRFLADLTDLKAGFAYVNTIPSQLGPSGDAVAKLGKSFDGAAASTQQLGTAAKGSSDAVKDFGSKASSAMQQTSSSVKEARGALGLLGNDIGVALPREVRTFLAQLPVVSAILGSAFAPVAIATFIDYLGTLAKKVEEFEDKPNRVAAAWAKSDEAFLTGSQHVKSEIDQQQQKIIELTQGPIAALDFALKHLETTAFETFQQIGADIDAVVANIEEANGNDIVFSPFGKKAIDDLKQFKTVLFQTMESARAANPGATLADSLAPYDAALSAVNAKIQQVQEHIASMIRGGADDAGMLDPLKAELKALQEINTALQQGVQLDKSRFAAADAAKAAAVRQEEAVQAKQTLDVQLSGIEKVTAAQHDAYESGKISITEWEQDQEQASISAYNAQLSYYEKLKQLFASDPQKLAAINAEALTFAQKGVAQSTEQLADSRHKLNLELQLGVAEENKLDTTKQAQGLKAASAAAEDYAKSLKTLEQAQQYLNDAAADVKFSAQAQAIERLAALGVITEEQKAQKLKALYQEEADYALAALQKELKQEESDIASANRQLLEAEASGDAKRIEEARTYLDQREAAYAQTATNILKTEQKFDTQYAAQENQMLQRASSSWKGFFLALSSGALKTGDALKVLGTLTAQGIGASVEAAVSGSSSFGAAMEQMLKSALAALAGQAVVNVLTDIAKAFDCFAAGDAAAAAFDYTSAGLFYSAGDKFLAGAVKWGVIGGAAAVGGAAIPSGNSSSSSSSSSSSDSAATTTNPSQTASPQPTPILNVQKLAAGGLALSPMLAMIGDAFGGGAAKEAILPLENPKTMGMIGGAIARNMPDQEPQIPAERMHQLMIAAATGMSADHYAVTDLAAGRVPQPQIYMPIARSQPSRIGDDETSLDAIAAKVSGRLRSSASSNPAPIIHHTNFDVHIDGMISPDNLTKVMRKMNQQVTRGRGRLKSNVTFRVTKRG